MESISFARICAKLIMFVTRGKRTCSARCFHFHLNIWGHRNAVRIKHTFNKRYLKKRIIIEANRALLSLKKNSGIVKGSK